MWIGQLVCILVTNKYVKHNQNPIWSSQITSTVEDIYEYDIPLIIYCEKCHVEHKRFCTTIHKDQC